MTQELQSERSREGPLAGHLTLCVLKTVWFAVRLPLLALFVILEPVVRVFLAGCALLMTLNALFFAAVRPLSSFPFWGMLALAVGCVGLLALYYRAMRLLSS